MKKKITINVFFLLFLSVTFTTSPFALPKKEIEELNQIIITARKQKENIQKIPNSVSVIEAIELDDLSIESIKEVSDQIPNMMSFQHGYPGMHTPVTRGISAGLHSLDVGTGLYIDGVPVLNPFGFDDPIIDVERVEVIRGPQGTLYGKGTEAGVINIVTKQPGNDFSKKISFDLAHMLSGEEGDLLKKKIGVSLSGPIVQNKLFVGFSGQYFEKDGFIAHSMTDEVVDDRSNWYGRTHFRYIPTEKTEISLILSHFESDDDSAQMNVSKNSAPMFGIQPPDYRRVSSNLKGSHKPKGDSQVLKFDFDLSPKLCLTSVTSSWRHEDKVFMDWDFGPLDIYPIDKDNTYVRISEELRLNYTSKNIKGLFGFFYDDSSLEIITSCDSMIPKFSSKTNQDIEGKTYAIFTHFSWILNDKFSLLTGFRYENEKKNFEDNITKNKKDESWGSFIPKVGMKYQISDQIISYIDISKGYRSGGFNRSKQIPEHLIYNQEELWSYEVGIKSSFLKNKLILNLAAFYMDITDMQVSQFINNRESVVTNAGQAISKGLEIETKAKLTPEISLMGHFGYCNIEYEEYNDFKGNYKGNKNPYTPEYTYSTGLQYRNKYGLFARTDIIGYGKMYLDKKNKYSRDSFCLLNAKLGYEAENYDIYFYGKNILDKDYDSHNTDDGFYTVYSDPGEIGLQLKIYF